MHTNKIQAENIPVLFDALIYQLLFSFFFLILAKLDLSPVGKTERNKFMFRDINTISSQPFQHLSKMFKNIPPPTNPAQKKKKKNQKLTIVFSHHRFYKHLNSVYDEIAFINKTKQKKKEITEGTYLSLRHLFEIVSIIYLGPNPSCPYLPKFKQLYYHHSYSQK